MVWTARNRLVTAYILYRRPDRLWLLQEYVWQQFDTTGLPALRKFMKFWTENLDGPIFSVTVGDVEIAEGAVLRFADHEGKA